MYRTGKSNGKADALTRLPNSVPTDKDDLRLKHQHRALLSPKYFQGYNPTFLADQEPSEEQINALIDEDLPLYARITLAN